MKDDMDINCGVILDGEASIEQIGQQIFDLVLEVASGRRSESEEGSASATTSSRPGRSAP